MNSMWPEIAHRLYGPDDALILAAGLVLICVFAVACTVAGIFACRLDGE
jgi:hypothetical protein